LRSSFGVLGRSGDGVAASEVDGEGVKGGDGDEDEDEDEDA
jgi:hypothetical protein